MTDHADLVLLRIGHQYINVPHQKQIAINAGRMNTT